MRTINLLCLLLALMISSCASSKKTTTSNEPNPMDSMSRQEIKDDLTKRLQQISNANTKQAAFTAALMDKDSVYYIESFGNLSENSNLSFTKNTVQPIGSISKTLAGVSLMKGVELGYFKLDDDINQYLNFKIQNPYHPNAKIRIKDLSTHTSSLKYTNDYDRTYLFNEKLPVAWAEPLKGKEKKYALKELNMVNSNSRISMEDFVKNIYSEGGKWYSKKNFLKKIPGTKYTYCNENAAIAALIIEKTSGLDYKDFVKKYILEPSGMTNTSWSLDDYAFEERGQLYYYKHPIPNYHLITYPDGGLVTSVSDFSKYFMNLINGYFGQDNIISAESYKTLFKEHHREKNEASGIFMELSNGLVGHNGGDPGIATFAYFDENTGEGLVIFFKAELNGELYKAVGKLRKVHKYFSAKQLK
ncbi:MAG: serine hydrolase domain-containing protein [Bacteroidota bacterium]